MCKELLLICILKCSSLARWPDILVALLIATVEVPIKPPNPLITPSRDLEGHQGSPVSPSRVPKEPLAPPNPPDTPVVLSKVPAKTPLVPPNPLYIPRIPSRVLAEKPLVPPNISEPPVPPTSISEPPIDPSRVPETPLVPLIYPSITTEGDAGPQRPTPQVRRKYKISSGHEAAIDFSSPTAPSITYSCSFANSLGSSFRSLSNNADNPLAINLDSPPISGPIESIAARKKNA